MKGARFSRMAIVSTAALLALAAAGVAFFMGNGGTAGAMPTCPAAPAIVLDPGHGGIDGGANVPGLLEKDIVLDIARRTRDYLELNQIPVILTRSDDVDLGGEFDGGRLRRDLNYRIRVANHCKAVFMLSLHVNSTKNGGERGMMIFYQASRPSRDAAQLLDHVLRTWPLHSRKEPPYPRTNLAVLKTKAPSVLLEMGFITNADDRQLLADPAYRQKVAQALASGCTTIYRTWMKQGSP